MNTKLHAFAPGVDGNLGVGSAEARELLEKKFFLHNFKQRAFLVVLFYQKFTKNSYTFIYICILQFLLIKQKSKVFMDRNRSELNK